MSQNVIRLHALAQQLEGQGCWFLASQIRKIITDTVRTDLRTVT